jgi:methionyl aminopeptidase
LFFKPGVTTDYIDRKVHEAILEHNAYPSPLHYMGFPKSICTSINEVMCHGIPDDRELCEGEIVNLDISTYLNGYHGDCSATFCVGNVDDQAKQLVRVTKECLYKGIEVCKPGASFFEIGNAIQ